MVRKKNPFQIDLGLSQPRTTGEPDSWFVFNSGLNFIELVQVYRKPEQKEQTVPMSLSHTFPSYDPWPWLWLMMNSPGLEFWLPALQMIEHVLKPTPVLNWTHLLWRLPSAARTILNWVLQEHKPGPEATTAKNKPDSRQEAGMGSGKSPRTASFNKVFFEEIVGDIILLSYRKIILPWVKSIWKTIQQTSWCCYLWELPLQISDQGCCARMNLSPGLALFLH